MPPNRSLAVTQKTCISSIPLPDSVLPSRKCPPDKVRPITTPNHPPNAVQSLIPRVPVPSSNNRQQQLNTAQQQKKNALTKLKIFKSGDSKPTPITTGKRTSSSSGVSSAKSEKSDSSSVSLEHPSAKSNCKLKQTRPIKTTTGLVKVTPSAIKKDATNLKQPPRTASEIERHAQKLANLPTSKLAEPKLKVAVSRNQQVSPALVARSPTPQSPGTGIPKPVAAVKGVNKVLRDDKDNLYSNSCIPGVRGENPLQIPEESFAKDNETTSECSNTSSTEIQGYSSSISCANTSIPEEPDTTSDSGFVQNKQPLVFMQRPLGPLAEKAEEKEQSNLNQEEHHNHLSQERIMVDVESNYSNMTLPSKKQFSFIYPDTNGLHYSDIALTNGYLSDGEVLRNPSNNPNNDGYLSEGGSNLYSRRIQITLQRQRLPSSGSLVPAGFTVLTGQGVRRGRTEEAPPPPTPRVSSRSKGTSTGSQVQESKHGQWKRYMDTPGMGSPPPPAPSSPTSGRKEKRSSPHGNSKEKSSKVRGIPQNFGYVKKTNGSSTAHNPNGPNCTPNGNAIIHTGLSNPSNKPTQVSVVPRTKVKVSGGTQTCSSDLQESHKGNLQYKSYSLTGNSATQLSQSVRERLLMGSQSLPKGSVASPEPGLILRQARPKVSDGSLSDTQALEGPGPYTPWLRHSNTYSVAPRLSETDSLESLSSLPGHRGSLTHARLLRDSPSRLSRSNSIRNVEPEIEPYYCLPVGAVTSHWSQPTSPAPSSTRTFPLSPTHSTPRHSIPKNDDVHGSSVSLVSTTSSLYSSAEEKQAHEIRKLRKELIDAQEKVHTLTSQLSTNAHVVAAFEQSLTSMTQRLQHLTATSEKKDSELAELRAAMDSLRAQTIQAGFGKVNSSSSGLSRQLSSDSVSSISSACSIERHEKKKKKGWLRSSFTKAFSRNAKVTKVTTQTESENERSHSSPTPSIPPPHQAPIDTGAEVAELQKQLREKDLVLTDIRLEALSSAHQLESLKDTVMKMRSEMLSLKQNNERLQRLVGGSVNVPPDVTNSGSMDPIADLIPLEEPPPELESDGKRITISVYLGQPQTFDKYYSDHYGNDKSEFSSAEIPISHTSIGASTSWVQLDNSVRRAFKQHLARLDPGGGLGLGGDAILSYKLGEAERRCDTSAPDLLPVGYVVGNVTSLHIVLQPLSALSFEALIPKGVAQRLVSLLTEHRRIVFCGAPGTGKTYLATRLAEFHAQAMGRDPTEAVATFNCDNKSGKELRQYLSHLNEQATSGDNNDFPCVVILDNLHKAGPFPDALGSLSRSLPCLLGTMAQSACSATSLQLQHGFRWVLVAPHMEPARGLLGRVLRRRLAAVELEQGPQTELAAVLGWLPRVWQHLNAFLETHSSGDVAIGPRLFLGCPLELDAARAWFADVWNYSLAPYLREAAREGLQLYGKRSAWIDPLKFILDSYPWPGASPQGLTSISARDVGLEMGSSAQSENEGDPLLNMIMRLQEAANCSSPHSNDSKNNTIDNTLTQNNHVDNKNSL